MSQPSKEEVWALMERLMSSMLKAIRKVDELAPEWSNEWLNAKDPKYNMQVNEFMDHLIRHSLEHRHELTSIRAAIRKSRPTDPRDTDPNTGEPYARTYYHWRLLEAFLRRAEMVSELIGLTDADLDCKPLPELVAGNERSVREVCEHLLEWEPWIVAGIENGLAAYRQTKGKSESGN